jgi:hypothetical protein
MLTGALSVSGYPGTLHQQLKDGPALICAIVLFGVVRLAKRLPTFVADQESRGLAPTMLPAADPS